jgi:hypothetical protein
MHLVVRSKSSPTAKLGNYRRLRLREFWLERWIASNSSSDLPEPTATHVSGDSAK